MNKMCARYLLVNMIVLRYRKCLAFAKNDSFQIGATEWRGKTIQL